MALNLLALPRELRNAIYEQYLHGYTNAPTWFNQQVRSYVLPVPTLAQVNQQLRQECLSYLYGSMTVTMSIKTEAEETFWRTWRKHVPIHLLKQLRRFEIIGPSTCPGVQHDRIIINLNNPNSLAICGAQLPGHHITGCPCAANYALTVAHVVRFLQVGWRPGTLLQMTRRKLLRVFRMVLATSPDRSDTPDIREARRNLA